MNTVTDLEAKAGFDEILNRVKRGEDIVITKDNLPVARLVREQPRDLAAVRQAVQRLEELHVRMLGRGLVPRSDEQIKSAVVEARRF